MTPELLDLFTKAFMLVLTAGISLTAFFLKAALSDLKTIENRLSSSDRTMAQLEANDRRHDEDIRRLDNAMIRREDQLSRIQNQLAGVVSQLDAVSQDLRLFGPVVHDIRERVSKMEGAR